MATYDRLMELANTLGAAQTHGFVPMAGHSVLGDTANIAAQSSLPVVASTPPAIPAQPSADMPAPGAPPLDAMPGGFPPAGSPLHDYLVQHFQAQSAQNAQAAQDARAFMGPGGPVDTLQLDALDKTRQAGEITQAATQRQGLGQAELDRQQGEQLSQEQRADDVRMRKRDAMVRDYQGRADVLAEQAQNMEVRDFWADKSTGSRILGILAQTLSGAANGLAGNPGAPSPLDRIIDRDLEVQRANLQNKRLGADRAQNALAQVYNGFEHEDASIAAYRQAAAKWYAVKSSELANQFKTDTAAAEDMKVQAAAEQTIAKSKADIAKVATDSYDVLHRAADDNLTQIARDDSNERQTAMSRDEQMVEVPGVSIGVRRALATPKLQQSMAVFADVLGQYDSVEKLISKPGFSLTDKAQADAANSLITGANRSILGTGANLSEKEAQDLKRLSVNYLHDKGVNAFSELSLPDSKAYIRAMRRAVSTTLRSRVRTLGVGADVARHPGFESAYDALREDE